MCALAHCTEHLARNWRLWFRSVTGPLHWRPFGSMTLYVVWAPRRRQGQAGPRHAFAHLRKDRKENRARRRDGAVAVHDVPTTVRTRAVPRGASGLGAPRGRGPALTSLTGERLGPADMLRTGHCTLCAARMRFHLPAAAAAARHPRAAVALVPRGRASRPGPATAREPAGNHVRGLMVDLI